MRGSAPSDGGARLDVAAIVARARATQGSDGRLPHGDMLGWEIFPFEVDGLTLRALEDPVPEPPRSGDDPAECTICAAPDSDYAWTDDLWRLRAGQDVRVPMLLLEPRAHVDLGDLDDGLAGELGRMVVRVERALAAVPGVARVHVHRWGDGAAHLHLFFLARPEGLRQMRGVTMPVWANHLPPLPAEEWQAIVDAVVARLEGGRECREGVGPL